MADSATIRSRLAESIEVKGAALADDNLMALAGRCAEQLAEALGSGHKVIFMGNGGSAADATHLAAEFVGKFRLDRDPLPALSLSDNCSSMSAIGNDFSYEDTFERQVRAFANKGDVVVGLSTSGTSRNVISGLRAARAAGARTVAFTGATGGDCLAVADICLLMPSSVTARVQEAYMVICHAICEQVETDLFQGR